MSILQVGMQGFTLRDERNKRTGQKRILVLADSALYDDDFLTILDATDPSTGYYVPGPSDAWDASRDSLTVISRDVQPLDELDGAQQYHAFLILVDYSTPDGGDIGQENDDPTARDWEWTVSSENDQRVMTHSRFAVDDDISSYYPGLEIVKLGAGKAFANTAGEPPESGVLGNHKKRVITCSKYYSAFSDIGTIASATELESYIDTVNSLDASVLDVLRPKWTLYMDDIEYRGVTVNDENYLHVTFRMTYDPLTHIHVFPSAGYNEIDASGDLRAIRLASGEEAGQAQLLDATGAVVATPAASPYLKTPVLVAGANEDQSDFTALGLPTAIPGI